MADVTFPITYNTSSVGTPMVQMDPANGRRVFDRICNKNIELIEQGMSAKYIVIDKKSYTDLISCVEEVMTRNDTYNDPMRSRWDLTINLSSGQAEFIVLPQDKRRIQVIPETEDVLFRMNR